MQIRIPSFDDHFPLKKVPNHCNTYTQHSPNDIDLPATIALRMISQYKHIFRYLTLSKNGVNNIKRNYHELPQKYREIQDVCRRFSDNELKPVAGELDKSRKFPQEQIRKLGEMGFMGLLVSKNHGGSELDMLSAAIAVEELSRGCASTGAIVSIHNILYANFLDRFGYDSQKKIFLEPYVKGIPGAFALSEAEAGSDVSNISTTASKQGNTFILNGEKTWVTSAYEAEIGIIFATIDKSMKHKGLGAFIVPLNFKGVTRGKPEKKMGIRATSTCSLYLSDVEIPAENLVASLGDGFRMAMEQLNKARIGISSQAVGIAQACLDTALEYATNRKAFGKSLVDFQGVQLKLAEMATRIEAARTLVWKAASMCDKEENYILNSSMAKLFAGKTATYCAHECVQILGGMGYVEDTPAERYYRDARITEIYGGVSDIQKLIITDQLVRKK